MVRTIAVLVCVLALSVGVLAVLPPRDATSFDIPTIDAKKALLPELKTLSSRTIVDFGYTGGNTVSYSYLGASIEGKLAQNEVEELREKNSITELVSVSTTSKDTVVTLKSRFYAQPAFAQDAGGTWHYIEYATTTREAWHARTVPLWQRIAEVLVHAAYADTLSPFSGAGDGRILSQVSYIEPVQFDGCPGDAWVDAHEAVTGNGVDSTSVVAYAYATGDNFRDINGLLNCTAAIYRSFIPFDTSPIPADASVSAATLNIYVTLKLDQVDDGVDYATVVQTSQATHTTLANADFDQCGAISTPTEGIDTGERKDITSISTSAYLTFTLNSTGRSWITKAGQSSSCSATNGITCLGVREGHDSSNTGIYTGPTNYITFSTSEQTGTSQDPYLSVTYSVVGNAGLGGIRMGNGAQLRMAGGGLKLR